MGPTNLGLRYGSQSNVGAVPYVQAQNSEFAGIGALVGELFGGEASGARATAQLDRERARTMRAELEARQRLGELIANQVGNIAVVPNEAMGPDNVQAPPLTVEADMDLRRAAARGAITPEFIAQVLAQRVQAGEESAAGGNIGDILAVLATGAQDGDLQAGFRGQVLGPGQSVTQTGADRNFAAQEANDIAMNDADNAVARRGQDMDYQGRIDSANIAAAIDRERMAQDERASRTELELSRAARLDQQTIASAVNNAVGIGRGEDVRVPPEFRQRIIARTTELLRGNERLDPSTAATLAVDELTDERSDYGAWIRGVGGRRGFEWTDVGRAYRPSAPAAEQTAATTDAAPVTVTTQAQYDALPSGTVYIDSQGRRARKP